MKSEIMTVRPSFEPILISLRIALLILVGPLKVVSSNSVTALKRLLIGYCISDIFRMIFSHNVK